jgi:hypothetical protein
MAGGAFTFYNVGRLRLQDGTFDFLADTIVAALLSASYTPNVETHQNLADVSGVEVSGGGYVRQTLAGKAMTRSAAVVTADGTDVLFGTNVTITAKYLVLFDDTHASDGLLGYLDLNVGGGAVSSSAGTFEVQWNAAGIWTVS